MSTDFAPIFEKKFHDKVIPGLLMVLDDNANPRVQAHAGAALVNFSEDCPKNILTPYLDAIMAKLESILTAKFQELVEKGTKLVLEQVRTAINYMYLNKISAYIIIFLTCNNNFFQFIFFYRLLQLLHLLLIHVKNNL